MRFLVLLTMIFSLSPWASASAQTTTQVPSTTLAPVIPTVKLEAKKVEIVLNDEHRQGVDWEAIVSDFHNLQLKKEGNPIWEDKKYRLSVGEVSNEDYSVLLDALDTVGHVTQQNFAPIVLRKNEPMLADVSPEHELLPTIRLNLKWINSPASQDKLKIEPAIGLMLKDSSQPNTVVTLKTQTEMGLVDNATIVIGGFISEEEITKTRKFPLLGDLPLLGLVFRKQGKLMQRTETIIFLTMHTSSIEMPTEEKSNKSYEEIL